MPTTEDENIPIETRSETHADRVAFLVDGEAYYGAVREVAKQARCSLLILGWDVDSRMRLRRDEVDDGYPAELGEFLNALAERSPHLHIHILVWDFAMIYALEREWMPIYRLGWNTHHRLHFYMDDRHPIGASHHQKVVVADDKVALVSGFDLSKWRWDSSEHRADDPRRIDPAGRPYPPFHDIGMMVSGKVARALGDLVRQRWRRATDHSLHPPVAEEETDPWPASISPDLRDTPLSIALTLPRHGAQTPRREIESLYLRGIDVARRFIYIENQYLTCGGIAEALMKRLKEGQGPEVVIVLPLRTGGWLEQHTMDVLRDRLLLRLEDADKYARLRVVYPRLPHTQSQFVQIHSKLMVVDDHWLTIGSANLSNRSMGLDSECNLAIEQARDVAVQKAVASLRNRLLAEHMEVSEEKVAETLEETGSLCETVDHLSQGERRLERLKPQTTPEVDALVPEAGLVDPERPIAADRMVDLFVPGEEAKPASGRLIAAGGMLLLMVGLAAAWRWTPLGEWLTLNQIQAFVGEFSGLPGTPLLVIALFVVAGLVSVPLTLLVVVSVVTFGPMLGGLYAHVGATLSALAAYAIGSGMGRSTVRRLAGSGINRLSRRMGKRGIATVIFLRIVPVAPFTIINLVAGASHISLRDFVIGTLFGLLPGIIALAAFTDGIQRTLRRPADENLIWLAVVVAAILIGGWLIRRFLVNRPARGGGS